MTGMPLRPLEGPACRVRKTTLDDPSRFIGRDKHAPPPPGRTCLSGPRVAVVIWNGIVSSMPEMYLYAHELAHVIDGDPEGEQLSSLNEWRAAWNVDKQEIANTIINVRRRERILTDPVEGFATMFALASIDHRYLRTTNSAILGFLKKSRLL